MKINRIGPGGLFPARPAAEAAGAREGHMQPAAPRTDTITISQLGASHSAVAPLVRQIAAEVEACGSAGRLEQLRQAVEAGTYQVPAQSVADAILAHAGIL